MKKYLSRAYLILIFGILYIPIITLIFFSFNEANSTASFTGFSFRWYVELFRSPDTFIALRNTLILAVSSATLATIIGTAAAAGIYRPDYRQSSWIFYIQLSSPLKRLPFPL